MLGWFRRWVGFRRHDDAYARTRQLLADAIRKSILRQQEMGKTIWLVAHAQDIFNDIQDRLGQWKLDYEIVMQPIEVKQLLLASENQPLLDAGSIKLVHASLIPSTKPDGSKPDLETTVAMFVLDRNRDIEHDDRLDLFCRNVPIKFEVGYFLSLEDELVRTVLDDTAMLVLEQMGLAQHDLITSTMITSRLNRNLRRRSHAREKLTRAGEIDSRDDETGPPNPSSASI